MTNNDLIRRIRYIFEFNDAKMVALFALAGRKMSQENVINFMRKDDDPAFLALPDIEFATFLDGLIIDRRGKKDGPQPEPEKRLSNNIIFRKLKIALDMKDQDILDVLELVEFKLSKHELSAFFRKLGHKHYRECKDQVLRNFIKGLQIKMRGAGDNPESGFKWDNA